MGERFRREVLAHGGEIPPKDLINGKYKDQNLLCLLFENQDVTSASAATTIVNLAIMISNNDKSNILCIKKIFRKPNSVLNEEISGHGNAFDISSYKIDLQAYTCIFSL